MKKKNEFSDRYTYKYLLLLVSILCLVPAHSQEYKDTTIKIDSIIDKDKIFPPTPFLIRDPATYILLTTNNTFSLSIGSANMYDTYLSPLEYKGTSIKGMYEQMRQTTWFDYRFYKQQIIEIEFAKGDNPAKNASEYYFLANYRLGGHYRLLQTERFRLGVGGLWDVNAGVLYNERNGNNPATARAYTNLNLSAIASYKFKWFALRWQLDTPFVGMLFSPRYGQSYYEISLGNTVDVINFASLHNQRALRNYFTIDVPISKYIIRVGYQGSYYQTKVHNIQTHHYTNSFVIGFPLEGIKLPKPKAENRYW